MVTVADDGALSVTKVPSDRAVIGELARGPLVVGTTVATNALLERRGVPTMLVVTRGFGDLVHIGDQTRPQLFDPDARWPEPLCQLIVEVDGRLDAAGVEIEPLCVPADLAERALAAGVESVAVVLLHSHENPAHERAVASALAGHVPFVALGHEVSPELGYLARIETTLVDAAVTPLLRSALARDRVPPGAMAMRSDGSLCAAEDLRAPDAVLSGPAGGVLAVAAVARMAGFARAVGLDMGGTSTDICRVDSHEPPRRHGDVRVAGVRLRRPMLEVDTIAAGGGSILGNDGLRLSVGPRSAGADPGPQCYGRGGPPTLTDAALAEGLIDPSAFAPPLDPSRVRLPGPAADFLDLARESMAQAVRRLALSRGVDLADHALVSYGGAAGQHAAEVARRLGIRTVLVHPAAAVLCAFGQALARREESAVRALWRPMPEAMPEALAALDALAAGLPVMDTEHRSLELRYRGTDHALELPLPDPAGDPWPALVSAFEEMHRQRFGFARPSHALEVVNVRVRVCAAEPPVPDADADPFGLGEEQIDGPRLLVSPTTSVWVPAGFTAARRAGLLVLEDRAAPSPAPGHERTPHAVELWSGRFQAVATEAGAVLARLARSVNIRERHDFSCAVFDAAGRLVANAPHVPVHLGAMGETVRDLLRHLPEPEPGQAYLTNAPDAGGSHLPDLTVITPVSAGAERFFVACRAHHVDVGGLTPGSMPPRSSRIDDEGIVLRRLPLLDGGRLRELGQALAGCREPETVRADLEAQIASNAHAARLLTELGAPGLIAAWMAHLQDVAREAIDRVLASLAPGRAEDSIDGVPLRLALEPHEGGLLVDLSGSGGPHPGNLNAPQAVVRAAVLYSLRVLVDHPIPLNEGALERVSIRAPHPSIVHPPPEAAIAGGNVETSQRLVDLFLRAAGARAASQGTMNNLTLGGATPDGVRWSLYETIGGGTGASARGPGPSGRQVHMTNTRATDPEVLEARLPLRLWRFSRRPHSGGRGAFSGGDGLVRELEVLGAATAGLLATRRDSGAPGLLGGQPGEPGCDALRLGGVWQRWNGEATALGAGDRVRIETPGGGGCGAPTPTLAPDEEP
ncbi:MAG: hydantoinase B/oxoprolinase family protein [Deltaproteobacteria bacterium]|nr:hydantoinase B/oxoprolinase family protein [Deltaproteobacteria bacterium]